MALTNLELFTKAREEKIKYSASLLIFVLEQKKIEIVDDVDTIGIEASLQTYVKNCVKIWKAAGSHALHMEKKFGYTGPPTGWLNLEADIPDLNPKKSKKPTPPQKSKDFFELARSSKFRATAELRATNKTSKIVHAAKTALRKDGKNDLAFVIEEAEKSPTRAAKIRRLSGIADSLEKAPRKDVTLSTKIADDDGLAHLFHTGERRDAYVSTRTVSKGHGADIWPTYEDIKEAKKRCRPPGVKYASSPLSSSSFTTSLSFHSIYILNMSSTIFCPVSHIFALH